MDGTRFEFADKELRFRVERFLRSRHYPEFENIDVEVENGSVTLTGALCSYHEKQIALSSCQRVAGVVTLVDRIDVSARRRRMAVKLS